MKNGQAKCDSAIWNFTDSRSTEPVEMMSQGQSGEDDESELDRVAEKCSLVIKKVTMKDVGRYTCRQTKPRQGQDYQDYLSLVTSK